MAVLLIIVAVVIILVVHSNNKEKERQENQRRSEAYRIRSDYREGYDAWRRKNNPYIRLEVSNALLTERDINEILSHKSEIIRLNNEIFERHKAVSRRDEKFEREQELFSDICYNMSKEIIPDFGRYHYDVEWLKYKFDGGLSKEHFEVWQFFADEVCFAQDIDYTYRTDWRENAVCFNQYKEMTRQWAQSYYDNINAFISSIAKSYSTPSMVVFVDTKNGWSNESIDFHLQKIDKGINNTVFKSLSTFITPSDCEHIIVVDVFTENPQLIKVCEFLGTTRTPIIYISLLKCYDRDEVIKALEREKQKKLHSQAESIKSLYPQGYERWTFSCELNGHKGDYTDQKIVDSEDAIIKQQRQFEEENQREKEKKEKIEDEYNRIKKKYPIGTEYYEKYNSSYGKTKQEVVVEDEDGVAKYEIIYTKYLDLQKKYPLGLPAFKKYHSYDDGNNSAGYTIEEIIEYEDEIRQFEQKETNKLKQQRESLPTKVKNWDTLQNGMHYCYLLRYYPTTCEFEATDDEWDDRYTVWNFKNDPTKVSPDDHDEAMAWVVRNVKSKLIETFGKELLKHLTLVCIPASSKMITERRYKDFSSLLCKETGMNNSYSYINITKDATPKHLGGSGKPIVEYDADFFNNKNVIIFDDVITSGNSMLRMKAKLEGLEATVIAGISIGKTFHHRP